jgi:hypothetical protein
LYSVVRCRRDLFGDRADGVQVVEEVHDVFRAGKQRQMAADDQRFIAAVAFDLHRPLSHVLLFSLAFALVLGGGAVYHYLREPELVRVFTEEAIALSEENGFTEWLNQGRFYHGWALVGLPDLKEAKTLLDELNS